MTTKEQWEALIVESRFWRRTRETKSSRYTVFDSLDQETILEEHMSDFREKGGFRTPLENLASLDHPLARFYRLFYTREFEDFRQRTLSEVGGSASLARGVAELLIDQTFRYFLFVRANEIEARRFGQLIVGVCVFRNSFDETSMEFLKGALRQTHRRVFNSAVIPGTVRKTEFGEEAEEEEAEEEATFEPFQEEGLLLEYPRVVTQMLRGNRLEPDFVDEMLNVVGFGGIPMQNVTLNFPLSTNISLYNPHRKNILHVLHLLSLYASAEEEIDLLYVGDIPDFVKASIRDLVSRNVRFVPLPSKSSKTEIMSSRTSGKSFILILDQEGEEDSVLFDQIALLRTLPQERVKVVSLAFRIPSSRSVENEAFRFCKGVVLNSAWKNPKDTTMRLVWEPSDDLDAQYGVTRVYNTRCFQDYVVRPLYRFKPLELTSTDEAFGLIPGEFDSELEKTILQQYYDKFPNGIKTWVEVVDSEEHMDDFTILSSIRFLVYEKNLSLGKLIEFQNEILNFHLSDRSNPLFADAVKIRRGGLFPTLYLKPTPLTEAIERVFGGRDDEKTLANYTTYQGILRTRSNYVQQMEIRGIFSWERSKDNLLAFLQDLAPKSFGELITREPIRENLFSSFPLDEFHRPEDKGRDMAIVQLGDTLGNLLDVIVSQSSPGMYERGGVKTIYAFGSFDPRKIWNMVSNKKVEIQFFPESQIQMLQSKIPPTLPFILVEGYIPETAPQLRETVSVAKRELSKMSGYRGVARQVSGRVTYEPRGTGAEKSPFLLGVGRNIQAENCLVIGGEYEDMDFAVIGTRTLQRVHILAETESGAQICRSRLDAVRFPKRVTQRVFVQEDLTRSFVPPIRGQRYDLVLCSPYVFSRFFETPQSKRNFLRTLQEDLLKEGGRIQTLIIQRTEIENALVRAVLTDSGMTTRFEDFYFPVGKSISELQTFKYKSRQFIVSDFEVEGTQSGLRGELGTYNSDTYPLTPFSITHLHREVERGEAAFQAYKGVAVDVGKKVRETNNYVKRLLIEGVSDKTSVLDLACGHGQDFAKWFVPEHEIRAYVGLDASEKAISEGRKRFRSLETKPPFFKLDVQNLFGSSAWTFETSEYVRGRGYSVVSCQLSIHYGFSSEETIRTFIADVSQSLKMNGEFIVSTLDYKEISQRTRRELSSQVDLSEVVISDEHYRIRMTSEVAKRVVDGGVIGAGVAYSFHQFPKDEMSRETVEYIVDGRYFEELAKEAGLELVMEENFLKFSPEDEELRRRIEELDEQEKNVVGLYRVFKFKKTAELRDIPFKKPTGKPADEGKVRKMEAQRILLNEVSSSVPKFSRGLIYQPETLNVTPYYPHHEYEALHMVTETVFQIPRLFENLRERKVLDDRQRVFVQTDALAFRPPKTKLYDHVFLPPLVSSRLTREVLGGVSELLSEGGVIQGCYLDRESAMKLFPDPLEDAFANSIFSLRLEGEDRYLLDELDPELSVKFLRMESLREICSELGLRVSADIHVRIPEGTKEDQKRFLGLFKKFTIERGQAHIPVVEQEVGEEVIPVESLGLEDRFILVPRLLKKAAGTAAGESLKAENKKKYTTLNKDPLWRAKLSDSFEGETGVRMQTGEIFKSVSTALIYYRAQFAGYEGYEALNLNSGLPYPENLKPLSKAVTGKRGKEWKEREPGVLAKIYESKFTNAGSQADEPANLTPLRALLLTGNAQLFSDSKTRNELLEEVRARLRIIYGNI